MLEPVSGLKGNTLRNERTRSEPLNRVASSLWLDPSAHSANSTSIPDRFGGRVNSAQGLKKVPILIEKSPEHKLLQGARFGLDDGRPGVSPQFPTNAQAQPFIR